VTVEAYGPGADRFGELWRPAGDGPWPVVVLLHGGFWRAQRTLELMRPLAADLAGRGFAAWNLEYRRVGQPGGGWPGTCEDVAAGLDHLARLAGREPLDLDRLIVAGHSAGGHLALWSATRPGLPAGAPGAGPLVAPRLVVSLAGVCDLHAGAAGGIGEGAVAEFLGATPDQAPERYRLASPLARLPLGVAQLLIHGDADPRVPVEQSRRRPRRAGRAARRRPYGRDRPRLARLGRGHPPTREVHVTRQQPDLDAVARAILDANHYMTLGTADAAGRPWASPVFFAADRYRDLYWISSPEATHSRNLAARPELSIVVFDSQAPVGTGQAVYMAATAAELSGADLERGLRVYPGEAGLRAGARTKAPEDVLAPSLYRLYRATVTQHWVLDPEAAPDQRTPVSP
jgi:acetyl esterase/lipase